MNISHRGAVWQPLLAVCIYLMLAYALFAFAGLAPTPFACTGRYDMSHVRGIDLEII
jgi:hypothetical protein